MRRRLPRSWTPRADRRAGPRPAAEHGRQRGAALPVDPRLRPQPRPAQPSCRSASGTSGCRPSPPNGRCWRRIRPENVAPRSSTMSRPGISCKGAGPAAGNRSDWVNDLGWRRDEVDSPCVKLCVLHPVDRICLGCHRTSTRSRRWSPDDPEERRAVIAELPARRPANAPRRPRRPAGARRLRRPPAVLIPLPLKIFRGTARRPGDSALGARRPTRPRDGPLFGATSLAGPPDRRRPDRGRVSNPAPSGSCSARRGDEHRERPASAAAGPSHGPAARPRAW